MTSQVDLPFVLLPLGHGAVDGPVVVDADRQPPPQLAQVRSLVNLEVGGQRRETLICRVVFPVEGIRHGAPSFREETLTENDWDSVTHTPVPLILH